MAIKGISKNGNEMFVPRWFFEKNRDSASFFARGRVCRGTSISFDEFCECEKNVIKESDKAILVQFIYEWWECYGWDISQSKKRETKYSLWVPKSVLVYKNEFDKSEREYAERQAAYEAKREAAYHAAFEKGAKYNEYLRELAKANGVKLGNAKRTDTIQEILDRKGIEYIAKADFAA